MTNPWIAVVAALAGVVVGQFFSYLSERRKTRIDSVRLWSDRLRRLYGDFIQLLGEAQAYNAANYSRFDNAIDPPHSAKEIMHELYSLKAQLEFEGSEEMNALVKRLLKVASSVVDGDGRHSLTDLQRGQAEFVGVAKKSLNIPVTYADLPKGMIG